MSSSVFFKFKSQKDPQRVTFDGTGISVFELKREIISISRLGDGTDFDLSIYNEDNKEEYDDDTTIIPRSTSIIARRLPASKPGQGRAARYVSGKMPVTAKNSYRTEAGASSITAQKSSAAAGASAMSNAQTEEEKIAAMFAMGGDQWEQQKQHMASATAVHRPNGLKGKPVNVPEHPPPPGYICYRCGEKGHWIQVCPTNNDPTFDGKPRVKRTTGIPKSFLQTVEKPTSLANDGLTDESRQPSGVMVDADGNFVVSVPDQASWERYQAKAQASAAQEDAAATGSKELQERGLECPIDKRMFVDPMKTPCCGRTYCNDCIENALINSDLVCPGCSTDGVLIDNLVADEDMIAKIKAYEDEKKAEKKEAEAKAASPKPAEEPAEPKSPASTKSPNSPTTEKAVVSTTQATPASPKKRRAEDELESDRKGTTPVPTASTEEPSAPPAVTLAPLAPDVSDQDFAKQMNALAGATNMQMPMAFPGMGNNFNAAFNPMMFPGMPPLDPQMMAMQQQMMNQMMMGQGMGMPGMNGMNGMGFPGMFGGGLTPNFQNQQQWNSGFDNSNMNQQQPQANGATNNGGFSTQGFGQSGGNEDDNAYMRKPVNPHRNQGRQRKARPTDYREL